MDEQERIAKISARAAVHMEDWLGRLENSENTEDDLLASVYAGLIVAKLLGYSPQALVDDATKAATKLISQIPAEDLTSE